MEQAIIRIIDQYGYVGVGFLIAVENLFPPIPSEIILTFGGFLTTFSALRPAGVIAAATVGAVAGGCVLYLLGRLLNKDRLIRLIESRPVKILRLKKEDIGRAEKWFALHGGKAVFFCRFVPIVRSLISIPAGMARMAPGAFLGLTAAGTLIWNTALVLLGRAAGGAWTTIAAYVDVYAMVAAACLALVLLGILAVFVKKRFFS
ncbi:MAG: DedA family protein [Peptococcaceae bacterium]|nr:DedA family protein [Peptococcaceae bacterium]